jgi:hypothetical protein
MSPAQPVLVEAVLATLGLTLALVTPRLSSDRWRRPLRRALAVLAAVSAAAYVNFGAFHGNGLFAHDWEQFHYFLGSKYFAEVGYDGLYVASMGAEMQGRPEGQFQP